MASPALQPSLQDDQEDETEPNLSERSSIADQAEACLQAFQFDINRKLESATRITLEDELGRFRLWTSSMAVFADANVNLDFKLRYSPTIAVVIHDLLSSVLRALPVASKAQAQVASYSDDHDDLYEPMLIDTSNINVQDDVYASDTSSSDAGSDRRVLDDALSKDVRPHVTAMDSVASAINELLRLSNVIRYSARESRSAKALKYTEKDDDVERFGHFIQSYLDFRYPQMESSVRQRLTAASRQRRRRLLYQMKHQTKLRSLQAPHVHNRVAQIATVSPIQHIRLERRLSKVSQTGSEQQSRLRKRLKMSTSVVSRTQASTVRESLARKNMNNTAFTTLRPQSIVQNRQLMTFPSCPDSKDCPYCGAILQSLIKADVDWRNHVMKDLEPYVCILPQCPDDSLQGSPIVTFTSAAAWLEHMKSSHGAVWECSSDHHTPLSIQSLDEFNQHQVQVHGESDENLPLISRLAERSVHGPMRECPFMGPICSYADETQTPYGIFANDGVEKCVILHLKEISLLALRDLDSPKDEGEKIDSDAADQDRDGRNRQSMLSLLDDMSLSGSQSFSSFEGVLRDTTKQQSPFLAETWDDSGISSLSEFETQNWEELCAEIQARFNGPLPDTDNILAPFVLRAREFAAVSNPRQRFFENLRFDGMNDRYVSIEEPLDGTCRWFVKSDFYRSWLEASTVDTNRGILLISGPSGSGKSTLMKFATTCLREHMQEATVAHFFADPCGFSLQQSMVGMCRSLLTQIFTQRPELLTALDAEILTADIAFDDADLTKILTALIAKHQDHKLFLVIDPSYDYRFTGDAIEFSRRLIQLADLSKTYLRILLSNNHPGKGPTNLGIDKISSRLDLPSFNAEDIATYTIAKLRAQSEYPFEHISKLVVASASGTFLHAVLVVELMNRGFVTSSTDSLQIHRPGSIPQNIPTDLNNLYEVISEVLSSQNFGLRVLLHCMCSAWRPLTTRELRAVISQSLPKDSTPVPISVSEMADYILNISGGLAHVPKDREAPEFRHESFQVFFTPWFSRWPRLEHEHTHSLMASYCWTCLVGASAILNRRLEQDWPSRIHHLNAASLERSQIEEEFPFLEYAIINLSAHIEASWTRPFSSDQFVYDFPFAEWVALHGILHEQGPERALDDIGRLYALARDTFDHFEHQENGELFARSQASITDRGIDCVDEHYRFSLLAAIASNDRSSLRALMRPAVTLENDYTAPFDLFVRDLCAASTEGEYNPLDQKLNPSAATSGVVTLLEYEIVEFDEEVGVRVDFLTPQDIVFPVEAAVSSLLSHRTDILHRRDQSPLMWAAESGELEVVRCIIATGKIDVSVSEGHFVDALEVAWQKGHEKVVELLIAAGVPRSEM